MGTSISDDLILGATLEGLVADPSFPYFSEPDLPESVSYCVSLVTQDDAAGTLPHAVKEQFGAKNQLLPRAACSLAYRTEPGELLWTAVTEGDAVAPGVVHIYMSAPHVESTETAWVPVRTYYNGVGLVLLCYVQSDVRPPRASCAADDVASQVWR